jgi:hypothetical protein
MRDMMSAAWRALIANYPEAKNVQVGDVNKLLTALNLTRFDGVVVTAEAKAQWIEEKQRKDREDAARKDAKNWPKLFGRIRKQAPCGRKKTTVKISICLMRRLIVRITGWADLRTGGCRR